MEGTMEDVINKVQKLLNLALNPSASEAEATVALRKADDIMLRNALTDADISNKKEKSAVCEGNWPSPTVTVPPAARYVASTVAAFTETQGAEVVADGKTMLRFIGRKEDVDMAVYLIDLIQNTAATQCRAQRHMWEKPGMKSSEKDTMKHSFQYAMGLRMRQRLNNMVVQRYVGSGGTAIIVSKREDINAYVAEKYGKIPKNRATGPRKLYREPVIAGVKTADATVVTTGIGN
jgi:hypothetical protein